MSSIAHQQRWLKWKWVSAYWVAQTVLVWVLGPVISMVGPQFEWDELLRTLAMPRWIACALAVSAAIAVLQLLMLLPVQKPAPRRAEGTPLWVSCGVAGAVIAGLALTVIWAGGDLLWMMGHIGPQGDPHNGTMKIGREAWPNGWQWELYVVLAASWCVATPLLIAFVRRREKHSALGRVASRLFTGTMIEVGAIIPLDLLVRRRSDCYCAQGTYWSLLVCTAAALVVAGPAIAVPLLAERRKRYYQGHCGACGYDMRGSRGAERCPECGAGWKSPTEQGA